MSKTFHAVLCGLFAALGACEHDAAPGARAQDTEARTGDVAVQEATRGAVDSPGKPRSPIGVRHRDLGPATVSLPLEIELEISASRPVAGVTGEIAVRGGLFIAPEGSRFSIDSLEPDVPAAHVFTVVPTAEGTHRVVIVLAASIDGQMQAATHVIDVQVGAVADARRALSAPVRGEEGDEGDEGEEAVIVLPAR